jgi:hypothetical protein
MSETLRRVAVNLEVNDEPRTITVDREIAVKRVV